MGKFKDSMKKWRGNDYAEEYILGKREGTFEGTPEEDQLYGTTDHEIEQYKEWKEKRDEKIEARRKKLKTEADAWELEHGDTAMKEGPRTKEELEAIYDEAEKEVKIAEEALAEKKKSIDYYYGWLVHCTIYEGSRYHNDNPKPTQKKIQCLSSVAVDIVKPEILPKPDGDCDKKPAAV